MEANRDGPHRAGGSLGLKASSIPDHSEEATAIRPGVPDSQTRQRRAEIRSRPRWRSPDRLLVSNPLLKLRPGLTTFRCCRAAMPLPVARPGYVAFSERDEDTHIGPTSQSQFLEWRAASRALLALRWRPGRPPQAEGLPHNLCLSVLWRGGDRPEDPQLLVTGHIDLSVSHHGDEVRVAAQIRPRARRRYKQGLQHA